MIRFLLFRFGLIAITLLVLSISIFIITEVLPGDVATIMLGQGATSENLAHIRQELGLNRPAYVRYLEWIGGFLQGDLGESYVQRRPIIDIIKPRLVNSAILAGFAFIIAIPLAIVTGIWAGIRRGKVLDRVATTASLIAISLPEFVTGVLLIVVFSSTLDLLPSSSILLPGTTPLTMPKILVLPTLTLTGVLFAYIMRMTQANVVDVMKSDYVRTAILKGLSMHQIIFRHVVPNAMLPTISIIAMNIGWLVGGLIIVDNVFAYPGLGRLLLTAVTTRDVPLLQSVAMLIAAVYASSNLLADITYGFLNPRVRIGQ
jgi:peptide/nickel transport system permease protein